MIKDNRWVSFDGRTRQKLSELPIELRVKVEALFDEENRRNEETRKQKERMTDCNKSDIIRSIKAIRAYERKQYVRSSDSKMDVFLRCIGKKIGRDWACYKNAWKKI